MASQPRSRRSPAPHRSPDGRRVTPAGNAPAAPPSPRRGRADLDTAAVVRKVAIDHFYRQGYHGTTVRQIAASAGISISTLFHHYPGKLDLLTSIMAEVMDALIERTEQAAVHAPPDAASQLAALVHAHVLFHATRRRESFIGNSELRSLGAQRSAIVARRDHQQELFDSAVDAGVDAGVFTTSDPAMASRTIVTMSTAVAGWFRPSGPSSAEEVAAIYVEMALRIVGCAAPHPSPALHWPRGAPRRRA